MAKFTEEQINDIIDLRGKDGRQIDIFNLYGILFVGNTEDRVWNLDKKYVKLSEHDIPMSLDDFENCETEDDIRDTFGEELNDMIIDKLL